MPTWARGIGAVKTSSEERGTGSCDGGSVDFLKGGRNEASVVICCTSDAFGSPAYAESFGEKTGLIWSELGPDLVPDYSTSIRDGSFYGWPYCYYGQHVDPRVEPQRPDLIAKAISPDYALSSHVGPLGIAFYKGS